MYARIFLRCENKTELNATINDFQNRLKIISQDGSNLLLPSLTGELTNRFYTSNQILKNKVIVISGGTKGVGRQLALKCAASGARVIISGRDEDSAKLIINEAKDYSGNIKFKKQIYII